MPPTSGATRPGGRGRRRNGRRARGAGGSDESLAVEFEEQPASASAPIATAPSKSGEFHERPFGVSTMTVVALTTATASDPTSSPSSRDGFAAHQRDHPVRAALDLHLSHHLVGDHRGDQPDELIAGRTTHPGRIGDRVGVTLREGGQLGAVHDGAPGRVPRRRQRAGIHPAPDGVVADPEQPGGLADAKLRHVGHPSTASAERLTRSGRRCGPAA